MIQTKIDNRYKDGNIVQKNGVLVGNAKTMDMSRMTVPPGADISLQLNPPIVIGSELAKKIKETM